MSQQVINFCNYLIQVNLTNTQILQPSDICNPYQTQITNMLNDIDDYNIDWFHEPHSRKRRGLINIVGEISKELFGTLSQTDATIYLERFKHLYSMGAGRDTIIKKHTTLIQSIFNLVHETTNQSSSRDKHLQTQITALNTTINAMIKHTDNSVLAVMLKFKFQDLISFITLLLMSFQNKQRNFLQALAIGTRNANSPIIIPPQVLMEELDQIRTILSGKSVDLPFQLNRDTLPLFYHIASPQARIIDNQLIIMLTIPLIDTKEYHLYKVTSFPNHLYDNFYQFIIPNNEYIAIDEYREKFISFTNQELTNCHNVRPNDQHSLLTCMGLSPRMDIKVDRDDCEITLLTKDTVSENCNLRVSNITSELWLKLRKPNSWIYVFPNKQIIYIGCLNHQVIEQVLEGTGIISIHEDCNIKTDKIFIQAYKIYQKEILMEVIPYGHLHVDINNTITQFTNLTKAKIKAITTPSVITFGQNDKLKEVSSNLNELIKLEDEIINKYSPYELREGITFMSYTARITIAIVIVILARLIYKKYKKQQKKKRRQLAHELQMPHIFDI